MLRFSVWGESDTKGEQLFTGNHNETARYLDEVGTENLEIGGICLDTDFSFDPIPAKKWNEWYNHMVLPALKENNWNDDLEIEYPDMGIDLGENE